MKQGENVLLKKFMLESSKMEARLFRNNVGMGWIGRTTGKEKLERSVRVKPGDVVIRQARPFHAGFPKGSSDLIGWTPVLVTQDMVGRTLAVFTSVEAKTEHVSATAEQKAWIRTINSAGGIGVIARKIQDFVIAIASFKTKREKDENRH